MAFLFMRRQPLLANDLDQHSPGAVAVELAVEYLLPGAEVQLPGSDGAGDLTPLDPPVHLGVVLAREVVIEPLRPRIERGEPFQPRFLALVQAGLVVDHEDADRDVLAAAWLIASYTSAL